MSKINCKIDSEYSEWSRRRMNCYSVARIEQLAWPCERNVEQRYPKSQLFVDDSNHRS